ncbi:MAG TPA: dTDP-4-dehydrorhamnose reductase, partial [Amycolatopsis sp.]
MPVRLTVLVPGGSGQLGHDLAALASDAVDVIAPGSAELDVTQTGQVLAAVGALAERARENGSA